MDWQWWYPFPSIRGNRQSIFEQDLLQNFLPNLHEVKSVRDNIGVDADSVYWSLDREILNSDLYRTGPAGQGSNNILVEDKFSPAKTVFAFAPPADSIIYHNSGATVNWKIEIPAGETWQLSIAMAFGDTPNMLTSQVNRWLDEFPKAFAEIKQS